MEQPLISKYLQSTICPNNVLRFTNYLLTIYQVILNQQSQLYKSHPNNVYRRNMQISGVSIYLNNVAFTRFFLIINTY